MTSEQDQRFSGLMRRAQEGDQAAYRHLLVEVSEIVRPFIERRQGRIDIVEDLVQEVLLSIHKARHTYDPGRPFAPWLYAIARHRLADWLRYSIKRSQREVLDGIYREAPDRSDSVPGFGSEIPSFDGLNDAVAALPEKQRLIIELLKFQGLSIREAAKKTGMSESAVKVTAHRGYKALRKRLGVGS